MKIKAIMLIMQTAYTHILRDLLIKAIDDPDTDWDDVILRILDNIFDYSASK